MSNAMKWGIYVSTAQHARMTEAEVWRNSLDYCKHAERSGWGSAWLLEHHFTRYGLCGSPITLAGNILGATKTLEVGTAVSVMPLEHPIRLAESVAMLDHLSNGRFLFGVGRGFFVKDFEVFGSDVSKNSQAMDEWMKIILTAWTEGKVSWKSDLLEFDEVEVFPRPRTLPHPPMYVACSSPERTQWAAKLGFPMMVDYLTSDGEKRAQVQLYNDAADEAGHDPSKIFHMLSCIGFVGEEEYKKKLVRENMIWWENEFLRASHLFDPDYKHVKNYEFYHRQRESAKLRGDWLPEHRIEHLLELNPNGSPQQCIDRLGASLEATNIGTVVMGFEALANRELILESMDRFIEEVAPHVEVSFA